MSETQTASRTSDPLGGDGPPTFVKPDDLERPFATPIVASFDLDSLEMGSASALTPNGRTDRSD